jgi:hypothetical protein
MEKSELISYNNNIFLLYNWQFVAEHPCYPVVFLLVLPQLFDPPQTAPTPNSPHLTDCSAPYNPFSIQLPVRCKFDCIPHPCLLFKLFNPPTPWVVLTSFWKFR